MPQLIREQDIERLYQSGNFDPEWYSSQYPDVAILGMDPARHYLWIGKALGRRPSPDHQEMPGLEAGRHFAFDEGRGPNGFRSIQTFLKHERVDFSRRLRSKPETDYFDYSPKISVLMPAFRSPLGFLRKAIDSVINQSYGNWELIIVDDGSDSEELSLFLEDIRNLDKRIICQINSSNKGISGATNDALSLASGEFVALFDHDDIMTLDALSRYVDVLNAFPALDLIYSDECRIDENDITIDVFRKPDWSSAMLLNYMYTGHLSVYRREIIERVGGFRSAYDFSQDYDLALRVTELTDRVYHIAEVLYGWRAIAGSGAAGDKDFARETNIAALQDAMKRRGIRGAARPLPTANRVDRRNALPQPKVSIIIPSDNPNHIKEAILAIVKSTKYNNYDIIVVTNSNIIGDLEGKIDAKVSFAKFDSPFNFSAKCNVGARASDSEFFCFFNDDVRPVSEDWIEALLEYGIMSDVGAVGAKLLYENGTIQHAGMITGVRNLIGTAFHCLPGDTSAYFNMAQCVRDVSLLCGALILMPRGVFYAIGGWDEGAFAIAHSDTDLCLKVWDAGLRCVYTPYAELIHIGHVSIGSDELKEISSKVKKKDKGEIALLKRWPRQISADPYFTHQMVRSVYHDSQEYFRIFPGAQFPLSRGRDILIVSHELTQSGAPFVALEMARALRDSGNFVVVIAPEDGPMRKALVNEGITVIIDELTLTGHESISRFCKNFDIVIANTIVTWPLVKAITGDVSVKWYIHESNFIRNFLSENDIDFGDLDGLVDVWAVTSVPGKILAEHDWVTQLLPPGVSEAEIVSSRSRQGNDIEIVVLGGYEPRKGQDLSIEMLKHLPPSIREMVRLRCYGRPVDRVFLDALHEHAAHFPKNVFLEASLDREQAQSAIANADIVLVPSRDESFSLVVIEALQHGSVVVCSRAVGASEFLDHGKHAFIADFPSPQHLADAVVDAISRRSNWPAIQVAAKELARAEFSENSFKQRLLNALEPDPKLS